VLEVAPGLVHESGPVRAPDWAPQRVAVMAHWSTDVEPSRSVVTMLQELDAGGFETVLVSAAETDGPIGRVCSWAPGAPAMPEATTVLRRANVGYDFGSWASVLAAFPGIRQAARVLLVNDSLIGPFASLAPVLASFEASPTPVWGLSGSLQHRAHVQSFFVGYRDGVLDSPAMREFWADIRVERRKAKIVRYEELGLSEALDEAGIAWRTMVGPVPNGPQNPTINAWRELLGVGFPFVKAELVLAPPHWLSDWGAIPGALAAAFDCHLAEWVSPVTAPSPPRAVQIRARVGKQARDAADVRGLPGAGAYVVGALHRRLTRANGRTNARGPQQRLLREGAEASAPTSSVGPSSTRIRSAEPG
jgi:hypothetical protein